MEQEIKFKGHVLKIIQDSGQAHCPRSWDNFGTMVCFHNRYLLGDTGHGLTTNMFDSWDEMEKYLIKELDAAIVLPLYLYDHSGITMNTTGFSCSWDSGQVGFIYISKEKLRNEYSVKRISPQLKERVKGYLVGEVNTYDQYLTGDVYGFKLSKVTKCGECEEEHEDELDACWGFYGDDIRTNGILDHISKEHHEAILEAI